MASKAQSRSKAEGKASAAIGEQNVFIDGEEFTEVREGLGRILIPSLVPSDGKEKQSKSLEEHQKVFYNPIQQFNRDLTVLAIKAYGEDIVARRKALQESRINKKKRKREPAQESRPSKVEKTVHQTEKNDGTRTSSGDLGGVLPASDSVPMDVCEQSTETVPATAKGDDAFANTMSLDEMSADPEGHVAPLGAIEAQGEASDTIGARGDAALATAGPQTAPSEQRCQSSRGQSKAPEDRPPRILDGPHFKILDALSATGLRALRYVKELPFVTSVTANDLTPSAVKAIQRNAEYNGIASKIKATQGDARAHMYSLVVDELTRAHSFHPRVPRHRVAASSGKYDVIDLDPYGTAATFFDAAVQAVRDDGGLMCITCTDSGVWASNGYPEKAFSLYGGVPLKGFHSHEVGLRLVLNKVAMTAATHGLAVEPLLSLSIDYYMRIFVRITKSPARVKFLAGKTMVVYSCDQGCGAWTTQALARNKKAACSKGNEYFYKHGFAAAPTADPTCEHCGFKTHMAGPMYAGPLHSKDFIQRILDQLPNVSKEVYGTTARMEGMLSTALEEFLPAPPDETASIEDDELAAIDPYPFYFHPGQLAGTIHCNCPDEDSIRGALRRLGYKVTRSHCKAGSLKTNASWAVIWHVMREWARQKTPVKVDKIKAGTAAYRLLRLGSDKAAEEAVVPAPDDGAGDRSLDAQKEADVDQALEVDKLEVVFDKALGQDASKKRLVRYQMNPKENWGPLSKAKG